MSTADRSRSLDHFRDLIVALKAGVPVLRDDRVEAARARLEGGFHPSCHDLADSMVVCLVSDRLR
jgi:hypothetical protein